MDMIIKEVFSKLSLEEQQKYLADIIMSMQKEKQEIMLDVVYNMLIDNDDEEIK